MKRKLMLIVLALVAVIAASTPVSARPGGCFLVCSGPAPECCTTCCTGEPCFVPQCP
jgi:hypothetical protein